MDFSTYKYETHLIRDPKTDKSDDWQETSNKWVITLNGEDFDYYTGSAHRVIKGKLWGEQCATFERLSNVGFNRTLTAEGFKKLMALTKATPPKIEDVLYSLIMDSDACTMSFEEWCGDFGYEEDSIKALETYRACQKNADKLSKAKVYVSDEMREFFQEY